MEQVDGNELARINALLKNTSEFIAYFELTETTMRGWQEDIKKQTANIEQQSKAVHEQLAALNDSLTTAGTTRFRITSEQILSQGESQLKLLENNCSQFIKQVHQQQEQLAALTQQCIKQIEVQTSNAVQILKTELAQYDVHQFHRIANESCDHVERMAKDAVSKSKKLLGMFQFRYALFAIFTTVLTAFIMVLYLSDELPWEMHHQAMNERQAGKVLLDAWPKLSQEEKAKILNDDGSRNG